MVSIEEVTGAFENTRVSASGVSFAGKSLKLDSENDGKYNCNVSDRVYLCICILIIAAKPVVDAINSCTDLQYLNLEGNTLGVDASKAIANALEKHPEFKRAQWKDMFTGRMKTEIPKALVCHSFAYIFIVIYLEYK